MFSTLKITTKHEMSNDALWPLCGWSFSITVETKRVTCIMADCRTGSMANADMWKQAVNQHLLPFCGTLPGVPAREHPDSTRARSCHRTHSCTASRRGRHFFVLSVVQHQTKPEKLLSIWSTYSVLVHCEVLWPGVVRKTEKTGNYRQANPATQTNGWKTVTKNRISSHREDTLAKM